MPPSNVVYEYIVFRGSDVKDLRIEEAPKENKSSKPQMPDDPAILGVSTDTAADATMLLLSMNNSMMKIIGYNHIITTESANPVWNVSVAFLLISAIHLLEIHCAC